ncbi:hypothetical protein [Niallia endozanthoxylica]|uniref:Uncharacterized protein n=1 Tax=Niallia endozanthoxylica TaxID=2036016 RepID=A0A5J5I5T4_9BACI|nr:hypothetical protein [Niallia endozanthoxylica]KAA9031585.1 hypothetical protein F4V44_00635 [Niallia endozanthoxylica]
MPWQQKIGYLLGQPVGISFMDGTGTSGVLCDAYGGSLYIMEYLYQSQFAIKHYSYSMIQDIHLFPGCHNQQQTNGSVVY